jgi:hypothetical protein
MSKMPKRDKDCCVDILAFHQIISDSRKGEVPPRCSASATVRIPPPAQGQFADSRHSKARIPQNAWVSDTQNHVPKNV